MIPLSMEGRSVSTAVLGAIAKSNFSIQVGLHNILSNRSRKLVEAAGIEPASEKRVPKISTCVVSLQSLAAVPWV